MSEQKINTNQSDRLLTTAEAMQILRVRWGALYSYIYEGKLKAHKLGNGDKSRKNRRHWRILQSDLEAFMRGE